jgi:hypothetical protein
MSISKTDNEDGKMLVNLLKKAELFTTEDGNPYWRIKITEVPENIDFEDANTVNFIGYSFVDKINNKLFLNPPKDLLSYLAKDKKRLVKNEDKISEVEGKYGPNVFYGYYRLGSVKKASIEKLVEEIEEDDDIELNYSDMRAWALRKTAEYLMHEFIDYEPMLACITSQAQYINYIDSNAISELADIMESIKKKPKVTSIKKYSEEEEEDEMEDEETLKKKEKLAKYEKGIKNPKNSEELNAKLEKAIKKLRKELEKL